MFPVRFFPNAYFSPRFFPKVGGIAVASPESIDFTWQFVTDGSYTTPPTQWSTCPLGNDVLLKFSNDDESIASIAGWTISLYFYDEWGNLKFTLGVTITDPVNRLFQALVTSARTISLAPQTCNVSVWRTDSGAKGELAKASITLTQPPPQ